MKNQLTYWVTLAQIRGIATRRKNEIYVECFKRQRSIEDLFEDSLLRSELNLSQKEEETFVAAKAELSNNAFLVESLLNQGYSILPIDSKEYPKTLKKNLKALAPTVIYAKGDISLLQHPAVAIVGSRDAGELSIAFTKEMSALAGKDGKVVISGYAKGVDRAALDAAIDGGHKSIIVLPQGITTFTGGYKTYYKQIMSGQLLVVSEFGPEAGWSVGLAMARNVTIYGMADEIYVAQSDSKGGTWEGVTAGLKLGRKIFVRTPRADEKCANILLIAMGAKPVSYESEGERGDSIAEALTDLEEKLRTMLAAGGLSSKQIMEKLKLEMTDANMKKLLEQLPYIEKYKSGNKVYFRIIGTASAGLFD